MDPTLFTQTTFGNPNYNVIKWKWFIYPVHSELWAPHQGKSQCPSTTSRLKRWVSWTDNAFLSGEQEHCPEPGDWQEQHRHLGQFCKSRGSHFVWLVVSAGISPTERVLIKLKKKPFRLRCICPPPKRICLTNKIQRPCELGPYQTVKLPWTWDYCWCFGHWE